jgi:spore coat protein B
MAFELASIEPLIGKVVRIYKGGPESKIGRLISVTPTYVLVDTLNEGVIFYNLEHIKSITEDVNAKYPANNKPDDFYHRYTALDDFNKILNSMKYSLVKVDRGGPESRMGRLLGISSDFFVLYTQEDGVIYYHTQHVKSISEEPNNDKVLNKYPEYVDGSNLAGLLSNLKNSWVKINRGGPESVEGVLTDCSDDYLVVIHNKEVYRIALSHIRNITYVDTTTTNEIGVDEGSGQDAQQNSSQNDNSSSANNKARKSQSARKVVYASNANHKARNSQSVRRVVYTSSAKNKARNGQIVSRVVYTGVIKKKSR